MSTPKKPAHTRPQHFQQGPDEAEEEQREETAAAAQPPAARLYRHALESIFGFLSLKELSSVLAVSRSWQSAVGSMRSIDAVVKSRSLPAGRSLLTLSASRLARHIGSLGSKYQSIGVSHDSLYSAGLRMSGLHTLHSQLSPLFDAPLVFPPSLTQLRVKAPSTATPLEANLIIASASRIPSLTSLGLELPGLHPLVSFAPLRDSTQLRDLSLVMEQQWTLSLPQADQLRAIPNLAALGWEFDAQAIRMLLQRGDGPQQLPWQKLTIYGPLDDELVGLLAALPSFTDLTAANCNDVTFLQSLPNLRSLKLTAFAVSYPPPKPEQLIAGVGQCEHLTSLTIGYSLLNMHHVRAILSCMPHVSDLMLGNMPELEGLYFLTSESLQRSLTSLTLVVLPQPKSEWPYIFRLRHLTQLNLCGVFADKEVPMPLLMMIPKLKVSIM